MFPALPAPSLISGIYGGVCTSQNGGDKAQTFVNTHLSGRIVELGKQVVRAGSITGQETGSQGWLYNWSGNRCSITGQESSSQGWFYHRLENR